MKARIQGHQRRILICTGRAAERPIPRLGHGRVGRARGWHIAGRTPRRTSTVGPKQTGNVLLSLLAAVRRMAASFRGER